MSFGIVNDELRKKVDQLKSAGYQWVGDVYPIAHGHVAPAGFAGKPDERQRKFNFMVHVSQSQCRQDATIEDYKAGLVVGIPNDSLWCRWLIDGKLPDWYLGNASDEEILRTLALYHRVVDAFGMDRKEFHTRKFLYNEQVFEEWLVDYAERSGMHVESARNQVREERENRARSCGHVPGEARRHGTPRHPSAWYEERYGIYSDEMDPVDHDWTKSYECIRERIEREKVERESERKKQVGLTVSDMNAAGVTYKQLKSTETYRIDMDTKEIIIVRTRDGRFLRGTGKYVARLLA